MELEPILYVIPDGVIIQEKKTIFNIDNNLVSKYTTTNELLNPDYKYTFIPDTKHFDNINIIEKIHSNDVYEKYKISARVLGELLLCKDVKKIKKREKKIGHETYDEYLELISKHDKTKDQWIYNIIDGVSEIEKIIYQDDKIILIPNYTWDGDNVEKLHLLVIFKDKILRTIRDLNSVHIELLTHIKNICIDIIPNKYEIEKEYINMYFHYEPSTYQLHLHVTNLLNKELRNSVECSHHIDNVLFNISIKSDYYQSINMIKLL